MFIKLLGNHRMRVGKRVRRYRTRARDLKSTASWLGAPSGNFDAAHQIALLAAIDDRKHDSLFRVIVGCRDVEMGLVGELFVSKCGDCTLTSNATLPERLEYSSSG